MQKTWIGEAIRGEGVAFYIFAGCFWAVAGIIAFFTRTFLYNVVCGPFPIEIAELESVQDVSSLTRYYVTIEPAGVTKTGWSMPVNDTFTYEYVMAPVGRKVLLIRSNVKHDEAEFTGVLENDTPFIRDLRSSVIDRNPALAGRLLPFAMDSVRGFQFSGCLLIGFLAILGALGAWLAIVAYRRRANPLLHRYAIELSRHGPVEQIARAIDAETPDAVKFGDNTSISANWIWYFGAGQLHVFRLDDVVWIYKHQTIGQRVQNSYHLHDRHGMSMHINADELDTIRLIAELRRRLPWMVYDVNNELMYLWQTNRDAFVASVDERRKQIEANQFKAGE